MGGYILEVAGNRFYGPGNQPVMRLLDEPGTTSLWELDPLGSLSGYIRSGEALKLEDGGRITTESLAGSAATIASTYGFGEAIELRYNVGFTASQFQAIFARVAATVANSSTLRGAELDARNATDEDAGTIEGVYGSATVKGDGTISNAFGVDGNLSMDDGEAATITQGAAVRGKVQAEDAATLTKVDVFLAEHEAVSGAKLIRSVLGAKSGAAAAFGSIIDTRDATLEAVNTNQVRLFSFKDAAGNAKMLVYDPDDATAVSVANYA